MGEARRGKISLRVLSLPVSPKRRKMEKQIDENHRNGKSKQFSL